MCVFPIYKENKRQHDSASCVYYSGTIHDPNQTISALKVVPPVGSQWLLTSHIPNIQLEPETGIYDLWKKQKQTQVVSCYCCYKEENLESYTV